MSDRPKSPDCRDSNHGKCMGAAWDLDRDCQTSCKCPCHRGATQGGIEAEAERLYGPAPTGDEDPHASQAVPDPGETSGRIPVGLRAGDLTSDHLGMTLKVVDGTNTISGELGQVTHGASYIDEASFNQPTRVVLGRRWTQVEMLGYGGARVDPWATVELLG